VSALDDDLDELDDFVFEPTAWDFAVTMGIRVEPDDDRPALEELADAMLVWMEDGPELERLTDAALDRLWEPELERVVRDGLARLSGDDEWRVGAEAAIREFERGPRQAEVSREVVRHLAMQLSHVDAPVFFCVLCLDDGIRNAAEDPARRRELATRAAVVAARDAAVPEAELARVVARPTAVLELGTAARRAAVRRRLGRLAHYGRESVRGLAAELRLLAEEPLPARAEDDDVWEVVCGRLVAAAARPEEN